MEGPSKIDGTGSWLKQTMAWRQVATTQAAASRGNVSKEFLLLMLSGGDRVLCLLSSAAAGGTARLPPAPASFLDSALSAPASSPPPQTATPVYLWCANKQPCEKEMLNWLSSASCVSPACPCPEQCDVSPTTAQVSSCPAEPSLAGRRTLHIPAMSIQTPGTVHLTCTVCGCA